MNANIKDGNIGWETRTRGRHLFGLVHEGTALVREDINQGDGKHLGVVETYMLFLSCAQYSDNQTPEL